MSSFWVWHYLLPLLSAPLIAGSKLFERRPTRVGLLSCARAFALVEVGAAIGAKPTASIAAYPGHRDREVDLLADYVIEIQAIIPIKGHQQVILGQFPFLIRLQPVNRRNIKEIKALVNVHSHRRQASSAIELNCRGYPSSESQLIPGASSPGIYRRGSDNQAHFTSKPGLILRKHMMNVEPVVFTDLADVNLHHCSLFNKKSRN